MYGPLADLVLIVHSGFILFVIAGLVLTLLGGALRWRWVRSAWFRFTHLAAIGYVVLQAWLGVVCPLTLLENRLRRAAGQGRVYGDEGFIAHWLHALIFYTAPWWVFAVAYTAFGLLVALSFWWVPVRLARRVEAYNPKL